MSIFSHYAPLNYHQINTIEGTYTPSMVKSFNNRVFQLWERALFQRAASVIDFNNLPETWEGPVKDFFIYCLYKFGYVGVFETNENGLIFQPGSLSGYDIYYQPVKFLVANPHLTIQENEFTIGENCELIKLTPDYMGFLFC